MANSSIRKLIGWLGTLLVFVICGVLIGIRYLSPNQKLQNIDVPQYTVIRSDGSGGYTAELDADRLIYEERLVNPPAYKLDEYPEIKVLKNLLVNMTQQGDIYQLKLEIRAGVVEDDPTEVLKKGGIQLKNVEWTMSRSDIENQVRQEGAQESAQPTPQPQQHDGTLDFSSYVRTKRADNGDWTAELDVYRMCTDAGIDPAADPETNIGAKALRSLGVSVTKTDDGYLYQTTSTLETVMDDLKTAGLRITNTKWTWTEAQTAAHEGTVTPMPEPEGTEPKPANGGTIDFSAYVRTSRTEDGYRAEVDLYQMMVDSGVDPTADPETNVGAKALRSLGVSVTRGEDGYTFQTVSTLPTVMDDLKTAGLRITNTKWTWTEAETAAHQGTVTPLPTPQAPGQTAEATPAPSDGTANDPVTPTPTPDSGTHDPNTITTLYGFDQTEVRKAIRAAKEQMYGASLESSEVKYNYFAVGNASSPHGNVFRLVYLITTSSKTEYLIADVYDLVGETGYTAGNVTLKATTDRNAAKSTADLSAYQVFTLNDGSMVFPENNGRSPFNDEGLVMPKSISEKLTYDELWDIPTTEDMTLLRLLGYARNEMFARGGEKFSDTSNYRKFYSQYSWYNPTGKVTADELAEMYPATQKNITVIKFLEKLIKEG